MIEEKFTRIQYNSNDRFECPKLIENKFVIFDKSYAVLIKGQEQIDLLKKYLDFDFLLYEAQKSPTRELLYNEDTEFIVSCFHRESVYVQTKGSMFEGYLWDFDIEKEKTLPLEVFLNPDDNKKFFWTHSVKLKKTN